MSTVNDELKAYKARPVGNSPELMPLDISLFAQLIKAVNQHQHGIATKDYNNDDEDEAEKKLCMAIPKIGVKAYTRVWEVAPSSSNIVKGIDKVLKSMRIIFEAEGVADNDIVKLLA